MPRSSQVFGIYATADEVESALHGFRDAGFSAADVSVLFPEKTASSDVHCDDGEIEIVTESSTKAPEAAMVGIGSGAALGGAFGWLVGVGALAIPGIGPVIAAGPLISCLAGIGIGCALGGFAGSLVGLGVAEHDARHYESRMLKGGVLVAIHCRNAEEMQRAREIMEITRAEDISASEGSQTQEPNAA